jgi:hypothetical protein
METWGTTSSQVKTMINWLAEELSKTKYGEVGIVFTVHDAHVTKYEQIKLVKTSTLKDEDRVSEVSRKMRT